MTTLEADSKWMLVALLEGRKAQGRSYPNPPVGAVLVMNSQVISTGYTQHNGGSHAEVVCLNAVSEPVDGATLYVTLEPCNQIGLTGKCTDTIRSRGISRVVIGMQDPNPDVCGSAIRELQSANIAVEAGVLEELCRRDLEEYAWRVRNGFTKGFAGESAKRWNDHSFSWIKHLENDRWAQEFIHEASLRTHLGDVRGLSVLDFGGGNGDISAKLNEWGANVTYTDHSSVLLEVARAKNNGNSVTFLTSDEFNNQSSDSRYDIIVASMVLHDIENLEQVLRQLHGRLNPGGLFYATSLHPCFKSTHSQWLKGRTEIDAQGQIIDRYGNFGVNMQAISGGGPSGIATINMHRKAEDYLNAFLNCGFAIRRVFEPDGRDHADYSSSAIEQADHWFRKSPILGVVCSINERFGQS